MANKTKDEKDKRKQRCVTLSDNEIEKIQALTKTESLSLAIRKMLQIIDNNALGDN